MFGTDTHNAEEAVKAARRRGLPIPPEVDAAAGMYEVIVKAGHEPAPDRPTKADIPGTPEELRQLIEDQAAAKRKAESIRSVASDYAEPLARSYNALVRAQVPGWIRALQPEFNGLIKQLRAQSKKLPADLDQDHLDWNDPAITSPWEKAEGIAFQLDQIVSDRREMARAGDLEGEGGNDSRLYAIAKLPEPTTKTVLANHFRDHVSPEIQQWRELRHKPVSRWLQLARSEHLTIELATPDEVRQRAALRGKWIDAIHARGVAAEPGTRAIKAVDAVLEAA